MKLYVGFGSNLGDRRHAILEASAAMAEIVGPMTALSSLYESEPVDMDSENKFLNAVACYETELSPAQLLFVSQEIEKAMGRTEKSRDGRHFDRIIDIDLLMLGDMEIDEEVLPGQRLTLPHPRMKERDFVMTPLTEIL